MSLSGKAHGPLNVCHGYAHCDTAVTSQWQFVSLKNAMHEHTKWKQTHLSLLNKLHPIGIDGCDDDKYSWFWFCHVICGNTCVSVYLPVKNGSSLGVNRGWSGLAQVILLEWALISFDGFGLADPAGIISANNPLIKARPVVGFMEHDGGVSFITHVVHQIINRHGDSTETSG